MIPGVFPLEYLLFSDRMEGETPHHTMREGWNCKVKKRLN